MSASFACGGALRGVAVGSSSIASSRSSSGAAAPSAAPGVALAGSRSSRRRRASASTSAAAESADAPSAANERYMARGVSASKEDVHAAIANVDKGLFPKAFCKVVPDLLTGDEDYCTCMHADGAGTKSSLAYMYWKETGDLSVWRGIAQDAVIMNTDDLLCIGCVDNILLSSTIGRNKSLITGEVLKALISGTEDVLATMRDNGVGILSTGGETADVGDLVRTVIVDSTVTARIKRDDVISNDGIRAGDVVVGMESYGQATYETEYNGGMGSNGLTSARHDVFHKDLAAKYPESFDASVPEELVYSGKYALTDVEPETVRQRGKVACLLLPFLPCRVFPKLRRVSLPQGKIPPKKPKPIRLFSQLSRVERCRHTTPPDVVACNARGHHAMTYSFILMQPEPSYRRRLVYVTATTSIPAG